MSELNAMLQCCLKVRLLLDAHAGPELDVMEEYALKHAQELDRIAAQRAEAERRMLALCDPDADLEDIHSLHADVWDLRDKTVPR